MTALCYVITMFVSIPLANSGGYLNLSDFLIVLTTIVLGPFYGIIVALIAPALADLTLGYGLYIPFTIVSKVLEAVIVYVLYNKNRTISRYILVFFAGIAMASIYMIPDYITYEKEFIPVLINLGFNSLQGTVGIILAIIVEKIFIKSKLIDLLNR